MRTILLVGEDELLLQTRAAVLHTVGAETITCRAAGALSLLQQRRFQLIVLCHSIASDVCEALTEAIAARWPAARILMVSPIRLCDQESALPGIDAISSADPERLVGRTVELLGRSRPRRVDPGASQLRRAAGR